jgi:hypothetical protein
VEENEEWREEKNRRRIVVRAEEWSRMKSGAEVGSIIESSIYRATEQRTQ